MIEAKKVKITPAMNKVAEKKAEALGRLKNSIRKGEGNITGFLGEMAANKIVKGKIVSGTSFDYDIVKDGKTYEVKTKARNVVPRSDYNATVCAKNTRQDCDNYLFASLCPLKNPTTAYIMGWIPKKEFYDKAFYLEKGQIDPGSNWPAQEDCYNVKYSELNSMEVFDAQPA
jgi:hypothetical protein